MIHKVSRVVAIVFLCMFGVIMTLDWTGHATSWWQTLPIVVVLVASVITYMFTGHKQREHSPT